MTNTNWQSYASEATMSHLTQMTGLTVQNFVSASVGMAVMAALIRGLARRRASTLGNFWADLGLQARSPAWLRPARLPRVELENDHRCSRDVAAADQRQRGNCE
jgi:hypothetical protein